MTPWYATFFALLGLYEGNQPVTDGLLSHRAIDTELSFIFVVSVSMNKCLNSRIVGDVRHHEAHLTYRQVSNIRRTLVGNKIVDNSDVVGASPVGAAPTTSSLST